MIFHRYAAQHSGFPLGLFLAVLLITTGACQAGTSLAQSGIVSTPPPLDTATPAAPTDTIDNIIPATGPTPLAITGCPDWDANKMYEHGEYLYGFYCAGCHGRQGQGYPGYNFPAPALAEGRITLSDNIEAPLYLMMNTDIHSHASLLFEKDALSVINYMRIAFANNTDIICPGEYEIAINP